MRAILALAAGFVFIVVALFVWPTAPVSRSNNKSTEGAFSFVQLCDTQIGFGGFDHDVDTLAKAVRHINTLDPDFVLVCGDMVGRPDNQKSVDAFHELINNLDMPHHLVPGNHDIGHPHTHEGLARYRRLFGDDYYSFDHEGHRFLVINTTLWKKDFGEETEQHDAWLEKELDRAAKDQLPTFIAGHHPLFALTPLEPSGVYNIPKPHRQHWLDAFADHGVYAFLTGHAHASFERTYRGVRHVTTASTSFNLDNSPMGFRLWHIGADGGYQDELVAVIGAVPPEDNDERRAAMLQRNIKNNLNKVLPRGTTNKIESLFR